MTQMDDVVTFLGKSGTVTVKHIEDAGTPRGVGAGNRILVYTPKLTSNDWGIQRYIYDYDCESEIDTEANYFTLMTGLKTNIDKMNRRETITSYTKPATLVSMNLVSEDYVFSRPSNRLRGRFTIRVEWSI